MIVKDMMPTFELFRPERLEDALALTAKYGKDGWKLAGGYDSLTWFKERIKRPKAVIDLSGIAALHGIKESGDGLEIGALTTLTDIEEHPVVKAKFRVLADAAGQGGEQLVRQRRNLIEHAHEVALVEQQQQAVGLAGDGGRARAMVEQ